MQLTDSGPSRTRANHSTSRRGRDDPKKGPWRCSNCPKEFAQKEYRYKHQQRCIQASSRQKLTKQKSCVACAASKLGCDQGIPACSRCINRNKQCQYLSSAPDTSTHLNKNRGQLQSLQDRQSDSDQQVAQDHLFYFGNEAHSSLGENVHPQEIRSSSPSELETNMRASNDTESATAATNPIALPDMHPHLQQQHKLLPAATPNMNVGTWNIESAKTAQVITDQLPDGAFGDMNINQDWFQRRLDVFGNGGSESGDSASRWQRNGSWISRSPFMSPDGQTTDELDEGTGGNVMVGISNEDMNFDLLGSLGILTQSQITPSSITQQPTFSPIFNAVASSTSSGLITAPSTESSSTKQLSGIDKENSSSKTLHDAVRSTRTDSLSTTPTPQRSFNVNERLNSCPFHKLNTEDDLVRIICGYPGVMVQPGVYPPFVHHKLYRCSAGDIAEPLARAFCCIGAFYASVPTSETFVHSLINEESRKLVKGFHQWPGSDSDMLAVVHAMCVYQILGFFVSSSSDQARSAELQHLFFLKMTRQLIRQCLQSTTSQRGEETNWRKWIMDETIRRTVFLVNAINILSCRIQKQDPYYFEPLNDTLIRSMALPAPEAVWKSSSAEEWMATKAQLGSEGMASSKLTIQQAIEQFRDGGVSSNTGACRIHYESFDEFTRLVLATIEN